MTRLVLCFSARVQALKSAGLDSPDNSEISLQDIKSLEPVVDQLFVIAKQAQKSDPSGSSPMVSSSSSSLYVNKTSKGTESQSTV